MLPKLSANAPLLQRGTPVNELDQLVSRLQPSWIALRRDLHSFPEVGFTEFRTAACIASRLRNLGYDVRVGSELFDAEALVGMPPAEIIETARRRAIEGGADPSLVARMEGGFTGVVAELRRGAGPVVAMRFDIDALPITEPETASHFPSSLGFASRNRGLMHACGHDGHASIGIALAELAIEAQLPRAGTLRLIFQPAEEGGRGARPMAQAGIVDDADLFLALHIGCDLPSGQIATAATQMMFSTKWDATIHGRAAHAAGNPEAGQNALLAAAQAVTSLHALPRHGQFATHVNVGRIEAGTARNVVADRATMEIELRGDSQAAMDFMEQRGRIVLEAAAMAQGCTLDVVSRGVTIGERSSEAAKLVVGKAAALVVGEQSVLNEWPLGGGDDAAYFMKRVLDRGGEAAYFIVGSDLVAGHHATTFDFQERDIAIGARVLANVLAAA